jgi:integrase
MSKPTATRKRRPRGDGSVYQTKAGTWRGAVLVTDPVTGRQKRRYLSGRTAELVRSKVRRLRDDAERGITSAGPRLTTGSYVAGWLEAVRPTIRPATFRGYSSHVRTYWRPAIGAIPLAKLTPTDIERAMSALTARGVGPVTIRSARTTLRIALGRAVRDGLVNRNVAALSAGPRVPGHEIDYLDVAQIRTMMEATAADEYGAAWTIAATTGLRLGELLGLAFDDIDTTAGTLTVRRALARDAVGGWSLAEPKTSRSRRTIPLPAAARAAVEDQRGRQDAARAAAGTAWQDRTGLLFTDAVGRPLPPGHVSKAWRATADRLGLAVPFRALRHTAATAWLRAGVPLIVVSQALGHTGIAITAAHYAAVAPELRSATADAMDRALS